MRDSCGTQNEPDLLLVTFLRFPGQGGAMELIQDLFATVPDAQGVEQGHIGLPPAKRAIASLERILRASHPCQLQFSSGKDSSACANLLFTAAINVLADGLICPPIHVCHADTGVENPVVRALADAEQAKMEAFAAAHQIPLTIHRASPTLSASYAPRVIGGRALPPFPGVRRDCTTDWKIIPSQRVTRLVLEQTRPGHVPVVTIIGTRASESSARAVNTLAREESAHTLWFSPLGEARLSPILDWDVDDVWTYLGECAAGEHQSYSDFGDLMSFYSDAGASSCVVVADMRSTSKACGARGGCFVCTAVSQDGSATNMIASNPDRYPYLVPLVEFRDYIAATQWDWSKRNFLGRTIDGEGNIQVRADQYSPQMCESLLRYLLAAQDSANRLGAPARVCAIGLRELIAIDFYWSLRAWHPPFHALWVFLDHRAGNVQHAPRVSDPIRPTPLPTLGKIHVGRTWDDREHPLYPSGLRDPLWEMFSDSCGPPLRQNKAGKIFLDLEESAEFDVDEEGAAMFLDFEADRMIDQHHKVEADWTIAASIYLRYGLITLATGQSSGIDDMLRRAQWLQKNNLHGHQTAQDLRLRCTSVNAMQDEMFV